MLKGTAIKDRDQAWHAKHLIKLRKRERIRKHKLLISRASIVKNKALQKKLNKKDAKSRDLLKKDLERGRLYWFFIRWRGRILSIFNKVGNKIKSIFIKEDATKAEA